VITHPVRYLQIAYYAGPSLKSRLVFLKDVSLRPPSAGDSPMRSLLGLGKHVPLALRSYQEFTSSTKRFWVYYPGDGAALVLDRLARELPLRLVQSDARKGYQRALVDAVAHAAKPWVFIVDSDYQFAPNDFWRLEAYRGEFDVVLGIKTPRRDPLHRTVLSRGYNILLRICF